MRIHARRYRPELDDTRETPGKMKCDRRRQPHTAHSSLCAVFHFSHMYSPTTSQSPSSFSSQTPFLHCAHLIIVLARRVAFQPWLSHAKHPSLLPRKLVHRVSCLGLPTCTQSALIGSYPTDATRAGLSIGLSLLQDLAEGMYGSDSDSESDYGDADIRCDRPENQNLQDEDAYETALSRVEHARVGSVDADAYSEEGTVEGLGYARSEDTHA